MRKTFAVLLVFFSIASFATTWEIDPAHSAARFHIRHMMISNVGGEITGMKGTLEVDDKRPARLKLLVTLNPGTVNTDNPKRDEDLKSPNFLDVAKFPTIEFKSTRVAKESGDHYRITGDLTLHGVTKAVTFQDVEVTQAVKDPWGNTRRGILATLRLNRKDYGLNWNKKLDNGGVVVGDEVNIAVSAEAVKSAAPTQGQKH